MGHALPGTERQGCGSVVALRGALPRPDVASCFGKPYVRVSA